MKKHLTLTILTVLILAQAGSAWAESMIFNLSVTVPALIQMPAADQNQQVFNESGIVQEQQMVRNQEVVTVRSIVVL